nr:helicase-associated domain-containing protein [Brevibacterium daeguense]
MRAAPAPAGYDPGLVEVSDRVRGLVTELLPALQTSVLVQSDLTAVATGPVDPRLHAELDNIADVDTRGQGTVYRFTADSISRALRTGMSVADVHELIARVSSTGVPQPLRFLIDEAAAKLRRVQVAPARSVLVVDDPSDLEPLLADPQLLAAGLNRVSTTVAVAAVPQDRLASLLEAAGQPTLRHHATAGPPPRAARTRASAAVTRRSLLVPEKDLPHHIRGLLHARSAAASGSADSPLGILDVLREAAAAGSTVAVTVVGADGRRSRFPLRPVQVTTGRVRGIREAGGRATEVALGISRIASAEPLGDDR